MKNGRPKKSDIQIKDIVKHIRYSREEWQSIEVKLAASKMTFSDFIRKASARVAITPVNLEAIREMRNTRTELVRIGKNINDIARRAATIDSSEAVAKSVQDLMNCRKIAMELSEELDRLLNEIR